MHGVPAIGIKHRVNSMKSNVLVANDLDHVAATLESTNGSIPEAAKLLGVPNHRLNSYIMKHAPLQAILENKRIDLRDASEGTLHSFMHNPLIPDEDKLLTARWILEHLQADKYRKTHVTEVKPVATKDLSFEDLQKLKEEALKEMAASGINFDTMRVINEAS